MPPTNDASDSAVTNNSGMDIAKESVRSSVVLSSGNIIKSVVSVVASLIIARLLGPSDYGAFSLVLALSILLSIFVDFGAVYAIQHNAAYYLAKGEIGIARRMTKNAIIFTLITGSALSAACFLAAAPLSIFVLHRPDLVFYVQIASPLILAQNLFTAVTLAFVGWRSPGYTSGLYVLQPVLKLILAPLLILGFGLLGAVEGHVFSYLIAAPVGVIALYLLKLRNENSRPKASNVSTFENSSSLPSPKISSSNRSEDIEKKIAKSNSETSSFSLFIADVKTITGYGVPAFIASGVYQFATQSFVLFILSAFVPNNGLGYYSAAYNATQAIAVVATAIGFSLFSAFSSLSGISGDVRSALRYSITYVSVVLMPLSLFAIGAATPVMVTLYGASYAPAAVLFSFLILSYLPGALGITILPSFFNGIGKTKLTLVIQLVSSIVIFLLAPSLELLGQGIPGVLYSLIAAALVSAVMGTYLLKRFTNSFIDFQAAARIFLASDISFLAIYFLQAAIHFSHIAAVLVDFVVFFGIYLTTLPILRALSLEDFERLRESTGSLGFVRKLLDLILSYEIYIIKRTSSRSS